MLIKSDELKAKLNYLEFFSSFRPCLDRNFLRGYDRFGFGAFRIARGNFCKLTLNLTFGKNTG